MPTITPTAQDVGPNSVRVTWAGMATGDTIIAHNAEAHVISSIQGAGTFAGGTVIGLTGSLDGTNFVALTDRDGNALTGKTAAFLLDVGPAVVAFRPTIGSGSADSVTVTVVYEAIG